MVTAPFSLSPSLWETFPIHEDSFLQVRFYEYYLICLETNESNVIPGGGDWQE